MTAQSIVARWRTNAPANEAPHTRTNGDGVRKFRTSVEDSCQETTTAEGFNEKETRQASTKATFAAPLTFRRRPLCGLFFSRETIPRQAASANLPADMGEPFSVRRFAIVEPERLFVQIAEQTERLDADVGSMKTALQQTPEVLHTIGVDVAVHVFDRVIDNGVLVVCAQPVVRLKFVREDRGSGVDMLTDGGLKIFLFPGVNVTHDHLASALQHTEHNLLANRSAPLDLFGTLVLVHIPGLAADERFVNLNCPAELAARRFVLHGFANSLQHEPRGFLTDTQISGNLVTTNAVLTVGDQPNSNKPLIETDRGFIEQGADLGRELPPALRGATLPDTASFEKHRLFRLAVRTLNTLRPTIGGKVLKCVVRIGKVLNGFSHGLGCFHDSIMHQKGWVCQVIFRRT